jgi:Flp pilus assembly protein TadG
LRPLRREEGQGLVELAFAVVVVLLILIGTVEYSFVWNRKNDATHLANEAARLAAVRNTTWCTSVHDEAAANGIHAGTITLTYTPTPPTVGSAVTATVAGVKVADLAPNIVPFIPSSIGASASMRLEQDPNNPTALQTLCTFS